MKAFTSAAEQTIDMNIQEKKVDEINTALNNLNIQGLTSNIKRSENMVEIRKMENKIQQIQNSLSKFEHIKDSVLKGLKQLEYLKPKNCDCDFNFIYEKGNTNSMLDSISTRPVNAGQFDY
jgi:hypothetical protein